MACELELPSPVHKVEQAIGLLNASAVEGRVSWPPPPMRCLCAVVFGQNPETETLLVMRNEEEFNLHNRVTSIVYRWWVTVPIGRVLEQHPMLNLSQASPQTRKKKVA